MRWQRTRRSYVGSVATIVVFVSGCGGADPTPAPQGPVLPSPASAAPTSPAPSDTAKTTPARDLPAVARERSFAGAEAFVRHFVDEYSRAAVAGQAGILTPFYATTCKTCENLEETLNRNARTKARFERPPVIIRRVTVTAVNPDKPNNFEALVEVHQLSTTLVNASGHTLKSVAPEESLSSFALHWTGRNWVIDKIYLLETSKS